MKPIIVSVKRSAKDRQRYAIKRMTDAARRILRAGSMAEEIQAAQWTLAWAFIAGVRTHAGQTLH